MFGYCGKMENISKLHDCRIHYRQPYWLDTCCVGSVVGQFYSILNIYDCKAISHKPRKSMVVLYRVGIQ